MDIEGTPAERIRLHMRGTGNTGLQSMPSNSSKKVIDDIESFCYLCINSTICRSEIFLVFRSPNTQHAEPNPP